MTELNKYCQEFRLQVWDLIFNPDEVEDKKFLAEYQEHLKDCPVCAGEYERVKAIWEELKGVKLPEPPSDLEAKIKNRLSAVSRPHMTRFIKYATAASVLAAIFALLLIFSPNKTLPEAVAEAGKFHEMYLKGETNTLKEFATYDELDNYCKGILSLPQGAVPKMAQKSCAVCLCSCCVDVCDCVDCEAGCFTNKGTWLVFPEVAKPTSLFVVKKVITLPDYAKRSMDGMDCYMFPSGKLIVCAYTGNGVTYFWVSELGKEEMHKITREAMKEMN